ncbi:hypothetical protein EST38_g5741 [Candolleomyces aberdarensis]|uniref:Nephrocystin 3-like N-terminal domain-containing protein n=1 Tax=Candolleomyces aberdarensis TaxID=2316362 RepID=A0A4Q2DMF0_9AGAR|nr:hypothetical protein EST38_g5741 [Candolleomyces aberdarensis]
MPSLRIPGFIKSLFCGTAGTTSSPPGGATLNEATTTTATPTPESQQVIPPTQYPEEFQTFLSSYGWHPEAVKALDAIGPSASNTGSGQDRTPTPTPTPPDGNTTSFLTNARHVQMGDLRYIDASKHVTLNAKPSTHSIDGWELLLSNTAPNALHNSSARYDAPKCDEDTRVEVISEVMNWMQDRESPQRLLCMTGAAGAGKSALQQSIAELCETNGILGATFFFSTADPTRHTAATVIPTIAYQLGRRNPVLRSLIKAAVEHDPLIFSESLQTQMHSLIVAPIGELRKRRDFGTLPYAILIDGLDECTLEKQQVELLGIINHYVVNGDLPFRVFIASRPEWNIRTALEPGGYLHEAAYHIQLSDQYDASADIRRYLWRRLVDIGSRIRRAGGQPSWPSKEDVEKLVEAASGQFIYAATVVKYVSDRRGSPVDRLQIIITWTPQQSSNPKARPFETLDLLYTNILSAAKQAYEELDTNVGRDLVLLLRAHYVNYVGGVGRERFSTDDFDELVGLEANGHEILVSDLHSLLQFSKSSLPGFHSLDFYHRSFQEFLDSADRSKDLFVPYSRIFSFVAKCCLRRVDQVSLDSVPKGPKIKKKQQSPSLAITVSAAWALHSSLLKASTIEHDFLAEFVRNDGLEKLDKLLTLRYAMDEEHNVGYDAEVIDELELTSGIFLWFKNQQPDLATVVEPYHTKWAEREESGKQSLSRNVRNGKLKTWSTRKKGAKG